MASLLGSCHRQRESRVGTFSVADPLVSKQLVSGFYSVESGFRWAGPTFTFGLPIPESTGGPRTARFVVSLYLPPNELEQLGPVTITATGPEIQFGKVTYDKAGPHDFVVEIPPAFLCCTNVVPVTFSVDKHMRRENGDARDLAVVVTRFDFRI